MVRIAFILSICSFFLTRGMAQVDFEKKSILRASASFGIGSMLNEELNNIIIPTSLEYYIDEQTSVRSDAVFFIGHTEDVALGFLHNHSIMIGISQHLTKNKVFDPYFGLQSGMAISQYGIKNETIMALNENPSYENYWLIQNKKSSITLNALISPHVGINYFAKDYFHLFMDLRYIYGNHHSNISVKSLNEIRFEFGLGFNLNVKNVKKKLVD